ncbi:ZIP family metal transporter [Saccharospirillum sp.]|uniref:ZIP family metal transporter n=1 Tax=Saccharospirillum sp. TaxID=2033801 RepID=UPI0034A081E3
MFLTVIVIVVVSAALIAGAAWGIYGNLSAKVEGFIVALAGGALIVSAVLDLIGPATDVAPLWAVVVCVMAGATAFSVLDQFVNRKLGSDSGGGLLVAITLDGIPENLALGVALIGVGPLQVASLSGSIFLSNLPEAAGGAKAMSRNHSKAKVLGLWAVTAALLSVAALVGNLLLSGVPEAPLGLIRCVAGGAVVASLGTEVFPKAFKEDGYATGVATAIGVVFAIALGQLD